MGMFNSIYADMRCPVTGLVTKDAELQIKWQEKSSRLLEEYRIGSSLAGLPERYRDAWIQDKYFCDFCLKKTAAGDEVERRSGWHCFFVRMEHGKIIDVLDEETFPKSSVTKFIIHDRKNHTWKLEE